MKVSIQITLKLLHHILDQLVYILGIMEIKYINMILDFANQIKNTQKCLNFTLQKHLITELIRNHLDNVLDFGPMGCQTGFYLSVINNDSYEEVEEALAKTLEDVLVATEVPACNEVQCEWAASLFRRC